MILNRTASIAQKSRLRRIILSAVSALSLIPFLLEAQLQTITAFSAYSSVLSKRLDVQQADAVGGGVDVVYAVTEHFSVGLRGGYFLYSLNQTDQLNRWGWRFWNDRYYNKIQADMRADPSLTAVIGSVQKMDLLPLSLHCDYLMQVGEAMTVIPSLGAGAAFYQRRLYADETWTKSFPSANYSFTYNLRNFAPTKKGNPLFGTAGISLRYRLFASAGIYSSALYTHYAETKDSFGYTNFIAQNEIGLRLGLEFYY
jgi:hypothetical protein